MLLATAVPVSAHGQGPGRDISAEPPTWAADLVFAGGNAVLGGLAAGLTRVVHGGSFGAAFRDGALGGAVAYAGRRIAAEHFAGAGLLGREVGAVGASLMRNAARGAGPADELVLPLGVARLYLRRDTLASRLRASVRLDLPTVLAAAWMAVHADAVFDARASLSAGTPVFYTRERWIEGGWFGSQTAGVIWLRGNVNDPWPEAAERAVFAHERVHVLQYDFSYAAWGGAVDELVTGRLPGGRWIERYLDPGLHVAGWALANSIIPYRHRPWEHEAHFLSSVASHRE